MGILSGILIAGAVLVGSKVLYSGGKALYNDIKEEQKRRNTPCLFEDGFTEEQFVEMVVEAKKDIKRLKKYYVETAIVHGTALSQSGLSEWKFTIDFNDYGHLTGRYWIKSDNIDSTLPKVFADRISERIIQNRR
ncbi:hypothetical protein [Aristaeella lactis]|uniref:Uncharacterized protein n=1 Tax=Aristaeella lactis TaxID=3046383 RepID=A0AC61PL43_9FIRM|nr:hypothetical protein [Aristaeella lactis]QUA52197.1 hypothetical protein JYE50_10780 [Aristaeella lactis]SMC58723.1 hypothetical protein SAMN06297397_1577 [Aristaeella lactis]